MKRARLLLAIVIAMTVGIVCFQGAAAKKSKRGCVPVPHVGVKYSLGRLFDLINTGNPNKTLNFVMENGDSASLVGMTSKWIAEQCNLMVTLSYDENLIDELVEKGKIRDRSNDRDSYKKILLRFQVKNKSGKMLFGGRWFYLNDTNPGKRRKIRNRKKVYHAKNIWRKWKIKKGNVIEYFPAG